MVNEHLVSYFPARIYDDINDSAETIINPANCRSSTVNISTKDNFNFAQPEPIYVTRILSNWLEILMCDY